MFSSLLIRSEFSKPNDISEITYCLFFNMFTNLKLYQYVALFNRRHFLPEAVQLQNPFRSESDTSAKRSMITGVD